MTLTRTARILVAAAGATATLAAVATPAAAADTPHPATLCAAMNMTIAISPDDPVFGDAFGYDYAVSDGMGHAMTVDNTNGNLGMVTAVVNSTTHALSC